MSEVSLSSQLGGEVSLTWAFWKYQGRILDSNFWHELWRPVFVIGKESKKKYEVCQRAFENEIAMKLLSDIEKSGVDIRNIKI